MSNKKSNQTRGSLLSQLSPIKIVAFICVIIVFGLIVAATWIFIADSLKQGKDFDYTKASEYITFVDDKGNDKYVKATDEKVAVEYDVVEYTPAEGKPENDIKTDSLYADAVMSVYSGVYNENLSKVEKSENKTTGTIKLGDTVNFYYRGYVLDENNEPDYLDGMSNISGNDVREGANAHGLAIGSKGFISSFEAGLIGLNIEDYKIETVESGNVSDLMSGTDKYLFFVSYERSSATQDTQTATNVAIDLSLGGKKINEIYGDHFYENICEAVIGGKDNAFTVENARLGNVVYNYTSVTVDYAVKVNATLDVIFPAVYSNAELNNREAKFELYIVSIDSVVYEGTVTDEATYVNDLLAEDDAEVTKADLDEKYPDDTADTVKQYTLYLKDEAAESYEETNKSAREDAIWNYYLENVVVKNADDKTYKSELERVRQDYIDAFNTSYNSYKNYLTNMGQSTSSLSKESFAAQYFGLSSVTNWKETVTELADKEFTKKLIAYYIVGVEGATVAQADIDTEWTTLFDEAYEDYKTYYFNNTDTQYEYNVNDNTTSDDILEFLEGRSDLTKDGLDAFITSYNEGKDDADKLAADDYVAAYEQYLEANEETLKAAVKDFIKTAKLLADAAEDNAYYSAALGKVDARFELKAED